MRKKFNHEMIVFVRASFQQI